MELMTSAETYEPPPPAATVPKARLARTPTAARLFMVWIESYVIGRRKHAGCFIPRALLRLCRLAVARREDRPPEEQNRNQHRHRGNAGDRLRLLVP